jgi:3-hydroxybutyryl-CoA dehydrogenase
LDDQSVLDRLVAETTSCDFFIESLNESPASKQWLIEGIEANLRDHVPLLSHTLCTTATEVASWCVKPSRVVGFGLFPPLQQTPYPLEFVPALQTEVKMATLAREFWQRLGFEVVRVADTPALVRARLLCQVMNQAIFMLDEKLASAEDIDKALQLSYQLPLGPLAWADDIGLDVLLGTLTGLYEFWNEERYRPAPLLKQKVRARHLGKKVGRGFFVDPLVQPPEV